MVFSCWAAVSEQLPIRPLGEDVGGAAALVLAVILFGQIAIDFGRIAEPS